MLAKLFKYDMKSIVKQMLPLWILAPVVALILGFFGGVTASDVEQMDFIFSTHATNNTIMMILVIVFFGIMVAMSVLTILFIIQRFWNGLLGQEGYLMFTLPVKPWELITSKGLSACLVTLISGISGALSMFCLIIGVDSYVRSRIFTGLGELWKYLVQEFGAVVILDMILMILVGIFGIAKTVYHIYAAMAIGQLFQSKRKLAAGGAFIGIAVVLSIAASILGGILSAIDLDIFEILSNMTLLGHVTAGALALGLLIEVVQVVIFHVITERILATKLNLE